MIYYYHIYCLYMPLVSYKVDKSYSAMTLLDYPTKHFPKEPKDLMCGYFLPLTLTPSWLLAIQLAKFVAWLIIMMFKFKIRRQKELDKQIVVGKKMKFYLFLRQKFSHVRCIMVLNECCLIKFLFFFLRMTTNVPKKQGQNIWLIVTPIVFLETLLSSEVPKIYIMFAVSNNSLVI